MTTALINLDRDVDRLRHMRAQCERLGIVFERFPAVRGVELPEGMKSFFEKSDTLSPGEIGCYASHLVLMQRLVAGEIVGPLLVFEDDIELPADFPALLAALIASLPAGWDIVRLTNTAKRAYVNLAPLPGDRTLVRYSSVPGSTGAYLISAEGARKFLKPVPRYLPIDQDLRRVWVWGLDTYGVAPTPIRADIFETSSIDAMAPKHARKNKARLARMRRGRLAESGARHAWTMRLLGFPRWLGAEAVNAATHLAPRKQRPRLLARAARWLAPKQSAQ